jgi:PAS domain S-box-containing protein
MTPLHPPLLPSINSFTLSTAFDRTLVEMLFRTSAAGVALVDRELRYVRVNDTLATMNGVSASAHRGRAVREILPEGPAAELESLLVNVIRTGRPVVDLVVSAERPGIGVRHFLANYFPVIEDDGTTGGVAALVLEQTPAEHALREVESRLRSVTESGIVGVFLWSMDGGIYEANDAFLHMLGYTQDDLAGGLVDWRRMTPAEYAETDAAAVNELVTHGRHGQIAKEYIGKQGQRVPVVVTSAMLGGSSERGVCVCLDDTARRAAVQGLVRQAEELRTNDATLRGFLDHTPVLMGVVELRRTGAASEIVHVYDNPASERFFAAPEGGTASQRASAAPGVPDESIAIWVEHYREAERSGEPVAFEYDFDTAGGLRSLSVTVTRIGPGRDGSTRFAYVAEESTARREAEREQERLRAAEREESALRSALLEAMSDAYAAFDREWRYTYVNSRAEELLGRRSAELIGQNVWELFPGGRTGPAWDAAVRALREQRRVEYEYYLPPIGRWIRAATYPVSDGVAVVFRDVTAEREREREREEVLAAERAARAEAEAARREAEAASRAKSEFLAVMSHELRTPLNAIGGYAELMQLGIRGPITPQQREDLARIQKSQRHLLALINEVLNYARLESGAVSYEITPVALQEAIAAAEMLVTPQLRAKGLRFSVAGCDPSLTVLADRDKLQQILLNLLSNAIKFTTVRDGWPGLVEVRCMAAADDSTVRIEVRDTGSGIPEDRIDAVFEPFVQVDTRLVRPHGGAGLGLAISRDLARGMHGDLTVTSVVDHGSVFTITLPRYVA